MKISLIYPESPAGISDHRQGFKESLMSQFFNGGKHFSPFLSLPVLAGIAKEESPESKVKSYYETKSRLTNTDLEKIAQSDIVGITMITSQATRAYELGNILKAVYGLRGILAYGGRHATGIFEADEFRHEPFEHGKADAVFIGEAFVTWREFLREAQTCTTRQFYIDPDYMKKRQDTFSIPTPDRSELPINDFYFPASIILGVGCIYNCASCSVSGGVSMRPLEELLKEVSDVKDMQEKNGLNGLINRLLGRNAILIADNDIHLYSSFYRKSREKGHPETLRKVLESLKSPWIGQVGYNAGFDDEFLHLAEETGCKVLFFGFETYSQENLDAIGKKQNKLERYQEIMQNCAKRGIMVTGNYMFGLPLDKTGCGELALRHIRETGIHLPMTNIYTPFPGSRFFAEAVRDNRLLGKPSPSEWWRYSGARVQFYPESISPADLVIEHNKFREEAYKIGNIFRRLLKSRLPLNQLPFAFAANIVLGLNVGLRSDEYEVQKERLEHYGISIDQLT
ncbi:hypothetical protein HYU11_06000 [Candidatus Woesearchaeota archaeon]|nr:hypothetical protein [Candidatus Woesearchaeota archaeon]